MHENKRKKNISKYGISFNVYRNANGVDSIPHDWLLYTDYGSDYMKWINPNKDKFLADSLPFYGEKRIDVHKAYIEETNWYYTGKMGVFDSGDIGERKPEPQVIWQKVKYSLNGKLMGIEYSDFGLQEVPCFEYRHHYEELMKSYRQGIYIPLCPDSVWEK
jgi:hypothetical protein